MNILLAGTEIVGNYCLELILRAFLFISLYKSVSQVSVAMLKHSYSFVQLFVLVSSVSLHNISGERKTIPGHAWTGPQGSRSLRFPDFKQSVHECGNVQPYITAVFTPQPPMKYSWYSFLSEAGSTGRIMSTIRNRTRDLPACNAVPQPSAPPLRTG
jgi:hypothetical protein